MAYDIIWSLTWVTYHQTTGRPPSVSGGFVDWNLSNNLFISKSWQIACPWRLQLVSSTDVLIYVDVISNKQSIFSSQIRTPSFSINWPSLVSTARSPIILWRLWSHKPSHKHDSNKYQSKAFVICDHKSDETRSVTLVNKAYLVWLMFQVLSNQHY